jgi:glycosyltransferase involved in cell wall biosynthesis
VQSGSHFDKTASDKSRSGGVVSTPLHVAHAVLSLDVGGLERVVLALVREGRRRGQRVSVVCVEKPGALADEARAAGAEVVSLDKPPGRRAEYVGKAAGLLDRLKPGVIHTHQIGAAWYLGPGAAARKVPVLHTEHGNQFARAGGWGQRLKSRLFYRRTAKWIGRFCCVSAEIAAAVARWGTVPRRLVEVVPNGIDTRVAGGLPSPAEAKSSIGLPTGAVVIGTIGRLNEVKRQDRLLRAAAELRARFPALRLLIVGDGPERAALERLSNDLGLAAVTTYAGFQPRPELCLRAMDVFALTSRSEGFPVSILEAWAVGVPVVSTAVGGIPDLVTDGETGVLVLQEDAAGLVAALARPLADREFHAKLVRAAAETVRRKYSLTSVAAEYERMYRQLVGGR